MPVFEQKRAIFRGLCLLVGTWALLLTCLFAYVCQYTAARETVVFEGEGWGNWWYGPVTSLTDCTGDMADMLRIAGLNVVITIPIVRHWGE